MLKTREPLDVSAVQRYQMLRLKRLSGCLPIRNPDWHSSQQICSTCHIRFPSTTRQSCRPCANVGHNRGETKAAAACQHDKSATTVTCVRRRSWTCDNLKDWSLRPPGFTRRFSDPRNPAVSTIYLLESKTHELSMIQLLHHAALVSIQIIHVWRH